ncbi:cupredoxin domain-containing protein [Halopiger thermotolerans]
MTDTDTDTDRTRRTALKILGATAATTGLAAGAAAQENETDDSDGGGDESEQLPIILAGRTEYWYGVSPEEIEGEENPTLQFETGQEYELVWINVDGAEHELIVESEDGEELETSDSSETAGEAVSMTFEPSEDAAEYYCEYHPENMRGDVELGESFDLEPHEHGDHGHDHSGMNESESGYGSNESDE